MKSNFKVGNKIRITTKSSKEFDGLILPDSDTKKIVLKLSSGYNVGILKSNIKTSKTLSKPSKQKEKTHKSTKSSKINKNKQKKLPNISIIHTGGTISSKVDYETGAVTAKFTPKELLLMFPELKKICNINSYLLANMFSEDIRFAHYNLLVKAVKKEAESGADGIIITHGTDTLAYTSAALSFALEYLNIPILLVGAQRSSDRGSSDAFLNLLCACQYITKSNFCEVGICMHESTEDKSCLILSATKTKKFHTSSRDAFKSINTSPIARVYAKGSYENISSQHQTKQDEKTSKLKQTLFKENLKIGILKAHPNLNAKEILNYKGFNGLIIEGTGLGHLPINEMDKNTKENSKILRAIKTMAKNMPLFMTSQCTHGRINMNIYATGRKLKEAGILGDYNDMLTETAFIKMAWLLSNYTKQQAKQMMSENLRGEISKRTLSKTQEE